MVVAFYFRLHLAYFPRPVVAIFARPEQWRYQGGIVMSFFLCPNRLLSKKAITRQRVILAT